MWVSILSRLNTRSTAAPVQTVDVARAEGKTISARTFSCPSPARLRMASSSASASRSATIAGLAKGAAGNQADLVLPSQDLQPQTVYQPSVADGKPRWFSFQIAPTADPLAQQNILAHATRSTPKSPTSSRIWKKSVTC